MEPLRGRVAIREHAQQPSSAIWTPDGNPRDVNIHRGTVLAMGAPMVTKRGAEVAPGFKVGDEVLFVWSHRESYWTTPWTDGGPAAWVSAEHVVGVVEPYCVNCWDTGIRHMVDPATENDWIPDYTEHYCPCPIGQRVMERES